MKVRLLFDVDFKSRWKALRGAFVCIDNTYDHSLQKRIWEYYGLDSPHQFVEIHHPIWVEQEIHYV